MRFCCGYLAGFPTHSFPSPSETADRTYVGVGAVVLAAGNRLLLDRTHLGVRLCWRAAGIRRLFRGVPPLISGRWHFGWVGLATRPKRPLGPLGCPAAGCGRPIPSICCWLVAGSREPLSPPSCLCEWACSGRYYWHIRLFCLTLSCHGRCGYGPVMTSAGFRSTQASGVMV